MIYILISLWIGGHFTKFYSSRVANDTVSGMFYKPQHGAMSFVIDTPLKQIITYSYDTMIVYYPDKNKAFKIKSLENVLQQNRIATDPEESIKMLKKAGYIFLKKETRNDTIISYWTHEKMQTTIKILYDNKGRVFEITVKNPDGKTLYSTKTFGYAVLSDSIFFPEKIVTTTPVDTEVFMFDKIRIVPLDALPGIIKNPVLPEDVDVEIRGFDKR